MTHHSVITSLLRSKNLKIDKFGDFSNDIDVQFFSSKTDIFRDVISLIIKGRLRRTLCVRQSSPTVTCHLRNDRDAFLVLTHSYWNPMTLVFMII